MGVGTVMDAREVLVLITGANKAIALYKAIEEGVCHMWTVSQGLFYKNFIFYTILTSSSTTILFCSGLSIPAARQHPHGV